MVAGTSQYRVRRTLVHRLDTPIAVGDLVSAAGVMRQEVERVTGRAPDSSDWAMVETFDDEVLITTVLSDEVQTDDDMPVALAMAALTQVSAAAEAGDRSDMRDGNLDLAAATLNRLVRMLSGPR